MKRIFKKLTAIFLCFTLLTGWLPSITTTANAFLLHDWGDGRGWIYVNVSGPGVYSYTTDNPINEENETCHLVLIKGQEITIEWYTGITAAKYRKLGVNNNWIFSETYARNEGQDRKEYTFIPKDNTAIITVEAENYRCNLLDINYYVRMIDACNISFDANGKATTSFPSAQSIEKGTLLHVANPTATGYTFGGWYKDSACAQRFDCSSPILKDYTLYAKWTPITYNIEYEGTGGNGSMINQSFTYGTAQNLTSNIFTRPHYRFLGWSTTPDGAVQYTDGQNVCNLSSKNGATVTLYAIWEKINIITFDKNGIVTTFFPSAQTLKDGETATKPNNPIADGFTFTNWFVDKASTILYNFSDPVNDDLTIFAGWKPHTYTIHYDANGGSGSMTDSTCKYGTEQTLSANTFTRAGYTFTGWAETTDGTTKYSDTQSVTNLTAEDGATVTLFAVWEAIPAIAPTITNTQGGTAAHTFASGELTASVTAQAETDHTLGYQWYASDTNTNSGGAELSGETDPIYNIPEGTAVGTHYYYCVVTATRTDNGQTASSTSDPIPVTVTIDPPVIDYRKETLFLPSCVAFRIDGGEWQTGTDGSADISALIPAYGEPDATLEYRVQAHDSVIASASETLTIHARRQAPQITPKILKSVSDITVINTDAYETVEYGIDTDWNTTGRFTELIEGTTYNLNVRYPATDALFASDMTTKTIVTLAKDGKGILEKEESAKISGVTAANNGNAVDFGNADITLPLNIHEVSVDASGVFVPQNTTVKTPHITVKLPNGGKVNADGNLEAYGSLIVNGYTMTAPDHGSIFVNADGTITVPDGTIITVGETKITLEHGGKITYNAKDDTLVLPNGSTLYPNGTIMNHSTDDDNDVMVQPLEQTQKHLPFVDVNESDWYYDSITYAYDNNLMDGTSETKFEPNADTSRAMIVTILYRDTMESVVTAAAVSRSEIPFMDVDNDTWYSKAIKWGVQNDVAHGYGNNRFAPGNAITREELAVILYRYYNGLAQDNTVLSAFEDMDTVSDWAQDAVTWTVENNIMSGDGTNLYPHKTATRAQVAAMLMRISSHIAKEITK